MYLSRNQEIVATTIFYLITSSQLKLVFLYKTIIMKIEEVKKEGGTWEVKSIISEKKEKRKHNKKDNINTCFVVSWLFISY